MKPKFHIHSVPHEGIFKNKLMIEVPHEIYIKEHVIKCSFFYKMRFPVKITSNYEK